MTHSSVIVSLIVDLLFSFNVKVGDDQTLFWVPKPASIADASCLSPGDTLTFESPSFVLY